MDEMPAPPLDANRQRLLDTAMGELIRWQVPKIEKTVGPFDPTPFATYDAKRRAAIEACADKLRGYGDDVIAGLLAGGADTDVLAETWRAFVRDQLAGVPKAPQWYAGGFGHPDYIAELDHWAKMQTWSVHETLCLSIGIEPSAMPKAFMDEALKVEPTKLRSPLRFLLRQHELLRRQFDPGSFGWTVHAPDFLAWADRVDFETHPEFVRLLRKYHGETATAMPPAAGQPRTDQREVDTIAQLLTALAIDGYGYRPKASRSSIPTEIADVMAAMGMSITPETVLKYLRRGAAFLPDHWESDKR